VGPTPPGHGSPLLVGFGVGRCHRTTQAMPVVPKEGQHYECQNDIDF
jgi:hypothetical protein